MQRNWDSVAAGMTEAYLRWKYGAPAPLREDGSEMQDEQGAMRENEAVGDTGQGAGSQDGAAAQGSGGTQGEQDPQPMEQDHAGM